jgi:murein DD-endopeptidase MepM/ murein hydrolase activator NlpD
MLVCLAQPPQAAASSANVAALQLALKAVGTYKASVDGLYGPQTRLAVRRFQRRKRLVVDGVVGPRTRRALGRRGRPSLGRRVITLGQRGWDVAALQFMLRRRGYSPGPVDGGFGRGTLRALRRFQAARGLTADGAAGPATLAALRRRGVIFRGTPGGPVRFLRPLAAPITDGFGHVGGRRHTGLDFPAASGRTVRAAGRGVTVFAGWNFGGYGNLVVVRHRLGFTTWYAHLSRVTSWVGERVVGGTRVGLVGSTGRSTGPHLHWEVRRHNTPINPMPYLLAATAARASRSSGATGERGSEAARAAREHHHLECGGNPDNGRPASVPDDRSRYARAQLQACR